MPIEFPEDAARKAKTREAMAAVRHKLLVMSGKGGVGKSTVSVHLAVAFSSKGRKTGLLDVDLHGPSIPKMLGLLGRRVEADPEGLRPIPYSPYLGVVSMANIVDERDAAVIWRGPRKGAAIRQLLADVRWGPLDYLIIDAPPGTGDEPLSIAQWVPGVRAVVVTTPQQVAVEDVRRSLRFITKVAIPIAGVVENMSGLVCPHCGKEIELFGKGGGEDLARDWGVPFLGRIPLDPALVQEADRGRPFLERFPLTPTGRAFQEIADRLETSLT
jgi:Mrp family chromosome partitioning ATPase